MRFACRSSWREREFVCWEGVTMGSTCSALSSGCFLTTRVPLAAVAVFLPLPKKDQLSHHQLNRLHICMQLARA